MSLIIGLGILLFIIIGVGVVYSFSHKNTKNKNTLSKTSCKSPTNSTIIIDCNKDKQECIDGTCCNNPCNKSCCDKQYCIHDKICCDQNCLDKKGKCCTGTCINGECCDNSNVCIDYDGNKVCCTTSCIENTDGDKNCCKKQDICKDNHGSTICCYLNGSSCIDDKCCPKDNHCMNKKTNESECCSKEFCSTEDGCCKGGICSSKDGKTSICCPEGTTCLFGECVPSDQVHVCTFNGITTGKCDYRKEQCVNNNKYPCCPNEQVCVYPGQPEKACCSKKNESCVGKDVNKVCCNDSHKKCDDNDENCICCPHSNDVYIDGKCCPSPCFNLEGKRICCDGDGKQCLKDYNNDKLSSNICCDSDNIYNSVTGQQCCKGDICKKDGVEVCCREKGYKCNNGECKEICGKELCTGDQSCLKVVNVEGGSSVCYNNDCEFTSIDYDPPNIGNLEACNIDSDFVTITKNPKNFDGTFSRKTNEMTVVKGTCNAGNCSQRNNEQNVDAVIFKENDKSPSCQAIFNCDKLPILSYFNNEVPASYENSACMDGKDFTGVLCKDKNKTCTFSNNKYNCFSGWIIDSNNDCIGTTKYQQNMFKDLDNCHTKAVQLKHEAARLKQEAAEKTAFCKFDISDVNSRTCISCIPGYDFKSSKKDKCCPKIKNCLSGWYNDDCTCSKCNMQYVNTAHCNFYS